MRNQIRPSDIVSGLIILTIVEETEEYISQFQICGLVVDHTITWKKGWRSLLPFTRQSGAIYRAPSRDAAFDAVEEALLQCGEGVTVTVAAA